MPTLNWEEGIRLRIFRVNHKTRNVKWEKSDFKIPRKPWHTASVPVPVSLNPHKHWSKILHCFTDTDALNHEISSFSTLFLSRPTSTVQFKFRYITLSFTSRFHGAKSQNWVVLWVMKLQKRETNFSGICPCTLSQEQTSNSTNVFTLKII